MSPLTSEVGIEGAAAEPKDRILRPLEPEEVAEIACLFQIEPVLKSEEFRDRGNINFHTYAVHCSQGHEYLLQCINGEVFKKPIRIMEAMTAWIEAQHRSLARHRPEAAEVWEPITLVPARAGGLWVEAGSGPRKSVWRLMKLITNVDSWKSLEAAGVGRKQVLAQEMGKGLALTADFAKEVPLDGLETSLPGYRDTAGYFAQFHSVLGGAKTREEALPVLPKNEEVRESTEALYYLAIDADKARGRREDPELARFIELALKWEDRARLLQNGVNSGALSRTAIHGDTKIENFLFCRDTGKARCLVDLDTIMPHTWLADWGDMVRSLVNVAGEKERDLNEVHVDRDVYRWATDGFLSTSKETTKEEKDLMMGAVQAISLELGVRFLADYLRGDNYFMLGPQDAEDLNKVRAMVQLTLFERLLEAEAWSREAFTA